MNWDLIKEITDLDLIKMCNEIYDWNHSNDGCLDQKGLLATFAREYNNGDVWNIKDFVLREASDRFNKMVKAVLTSNIYMYVR